MSRKTPVRSPLSEKTKEKISSKLKGRKLSDITRHKMSISKTGDKNPSKRLDVKDKLRKVILGKKYPNRKSPPAFTDEHLKKLSLSRLGKKLKPHSIETKKKMSISQKGHLVSIESRVKSSITQTGRKRPNFSGVNHPNYKGGITSENQKIRDSLEIKLWRKACMERDNFTDQKTGIKGGNLEVHHINNFADFPELRTSIENGVTLSKESHKEFHKKYGRKNNTKEQIEEFLGL